MGAARGARAPKGRHKAQAGSEGTGAAGEAAALPPGPSPPFAQSHNATREAEERGAPGLTTWPLTAGSRAPGVSKDQREAPTRRGCSPERSDPRSHSDWGNTGCQGETTPRCCRCLLGVTWLSSASSEREQLPTWSSHGDVAGETLSPKPCRRARAPQTASPVTRCSHGPSAAHGPSPAPSPLGNP